MKKFICLVLVLSLLITSVLAADIYKIDADTSPILMSSGGISPFGYGDVGGGYTDNEALNLILDDTNSIWRDLRTGFSETITLLEYIEVYVDDLEGTLSSVLTQLISVDDSIDQVSGFINLLDENLEDYINAAVDDVVSSVELLDDHLGIVNSSIGSAVDELVAIDSNVSDILSEVDVGFINLLSKLVILDSSLSRVETTLEAPLYSTLTSFLSHSGSIVSGSHVSASNLLANGFSGLYNIFSLPAGTTYVNSLGNLSELSEIGLPGKIDNYFYQSMRRALYLSAGTSLLGPSGVDVDYPGSNSLPLSYVVNRGFRGIRSLIAGSEEDNIYSGTSISNSNVSSSFSATGLGPMINTWLGDIQNDVGLLSYVFASPSDLELKKDSENNMDAVGDSFLSPDSTSSVKVKDITSISSASDSIQSLGDTGVTPAQAFQQLNNGDLFEFFTQETANNLDTTVSTYSRDSSQQIVTSYYEDSRTQFFDLIGKGGDG